MKWGSEFPDSFFMCQKVSNRETQWPFFSNTQKEKFPQTFMKKKRGVHKLRLKGVILLLNPVSSRKFIFISYSLHFFMAVQFNKIFSMKYLSHLKENEWMKIEIIWQFCVIARVEIMQNSLFRKVARDSRWLFYCYYHYLVKN